MQTFKVFTYHTLSLKKPLENVFHQNKEIKNEREIKRMQEIGDLQQERKDRNPFPHLKR